MRFFSLSLKYCFLFIFWAFISGETKAQTPENVPTDKKAKKTGLILYGQASYYAEKFTGRRTANGETFNHSKFTAACNKLPLGTWIQVLNIRNGKIVVVKINDRLHPKTKRVIDLTRAGAKKLGFINAGLAQVKIVVLDQKLYK